MVISSIWAQLIVGPAISNTTNAMKAPVNLPETLNLNMHSPSTVTDRPGAGKSPDLSARPVIFGS
jgi:hypothetical protein